MPTLDEIGSQSQPKGALRDGIEILDTNAVVDFMSYSRVVLPADGFVFWTPLVPQCFKGALHFSQEIQQSEDETVGLATVAFSSECKIAEFECSPINTIWVASIPLSKGRQRFAFSQQQGFFTQAGLWHYFGHSIYPAMESQLLDPDNPLLPLLESMVVTSNSLGLWLALNNYNPPYYDWFRNTSMTLYPSMQVPANLPPPYGVVHIPEDGTRAIQAAPFLSRERNHYQLVADSVRVTLYGLQNNAALDFINCVMQYSVNSDNFGIMNMPVVKDGKRTQLELQTLAMKKVIDFEISYHQKRVADVSRQLILDALPVNYIAN